jgi:hypothetical protein
LEKVVVLVTLSTEKLGLQFLDSSVILYGFYKTQSRHTKGEDSFCNPTLGKYWMFTVMPLVCTDDPGKNSRLAMWSSAKGGGGGAAGRIPARPAAGMVGERQGRVLGPQGFDLRAHLRRKPCRRAGAAETGGGRRWEYDFGDERGGANQLVSVLALG